MEDKSKLQVKSMNDAEAKAEARNAPEGVHPFYHVLGKLGGQAVRDHYENYGK